MTMCVVDPAASPEVSFPYVAVILRSAFATKDLKNEILCFAQNDDVQGIVATTPYEILF